MFGPLRRADTTYCEDLFAEEQITLPPMGKSDHRPIALDLNEVNLIFLSVWRRFSWNSNRIRRRPQIAFSALHPGLRGSLREHFSHRSSHEIYYVKNIEYISCWTKCCFSRADNVSLSFAPPFWLRLKYFNSYLMDCITFCSDIHETDIHSLRMTPAATTQ